MNKNHSEKKTGRIILFVLSDLLLIFSVLLLNNYGSLSGIIAALAQYLWVVLILIGLLIAVIGILVTRSYDCTRAVALNGLMIIINGFWIGVARHAILSNKVTGDISVMFNYASVSFIILTIIFQLDLLFNESLRSFLTKNERPLNQTTFQSNYPTSNAYQTKKKRRKDLFESTEATPFEQTVTTPIPKSTKTTVRDFWDEDLDTTDLFREAETRKVDFKPDDVFSQVDNIFEFKNNSLFQTQKTEPTSRELKETKEPEWITSPPMPQKQTQDDLLDSNDLFVKKMLPADDISSDRVKQRKNDYSQILTPEEITAARVSARMKIRALETENRRKSYAKGHFLTEDNLSESSNPFDSNQAEPLFFREKNNN